MPKKQPRPGEVLSWCGYQIGKVSQYLFEHKQGWVVLSSITGLQMTRTSSCREGECCCALHLSPRLPHIFIFWSWLLWLCRSDPSSIDWLSSLLTKGRSTTDDTRSYGRSSFLPSCPYSCVLFFHHQSSSSGILYEHSPLTRATSYDGINKKTSSVHTNCLQNRWK